MDKDRKFAERYGVQAKRLAPVTDVSAEAARQAVEEFIATYPGLKALADEIRDED